MLSSPEKVPRAEYRAADQPGLVRMMADGLSSMPARLLFRMIEARPVTISPIRLSRMPPPTATRSTSCQLLRRAERRIITTSRCANSSAAPWIRPAASGSPSPSALSRPSRPISSVGRLPPEGHLPAWLTCCRNSSTRAKNADLLARSPMKPLRSRISRLQLLDGDRGQVGASVVADRRPRRFLRHACSPQRRLATEHKSMVREQLPGNEQLASSGTSQRCGSYVVFQRGARTVPVLPAIGWACSARSRSRQC